MFFLNGILCEKGRGSIGDNNGESVAFGAAVWKISASLCNAHKLGLEISKDGAGAGFLRVMIRFRDVLVAVSADDIRSMGKFWGKKATVSEIRDELVEGI